MRVTVRNNIRIENPSDEIINYCKRNLILTNPDYQKKVRMHFWTGNTPQQLYLYEKDGNNLILPVGTLTDILPLVPEFHYDFGSQSIVFYNCKIPLYDYQRLAVDHMIKHRMGILQSPAGSGKTQMGIALLTELGNKTLWLTHTKDLLNQSKARAEQYMNPDLIGTITEGKVNIGTGVTFATIQTMCKLDLDRYRHVWDTVIVDECHRCTGTPTAMTQFYKVLNNLVARHKYGLSATVHRADGMIKATYALLGPVIYTVPKEAVKDRVINVGIQECRTHVQMSDECLNTDGTINHTKLITYLSRNKTRNSLIALHIMTNAEHSSLILSDRLEHLEAIMANLPRTMQEQSVMISGKMTSKSGKAVREQAIQDMRDGKKKYLFATYSLAKEGLDIPRLERLYMATPQKDYAVVTQTIGRIARVCEGKKDAICYDFIDDMDYLRRMYKKRCVTYRKNDCYWIEEE